MPTLHSTMRCASYALLTYVAYRRYARQKLELTKLRIVY